MTQNDEIYRDKYIKNKSDYIYLKDMEGAGIISSIKNKLTPGSNKKDIDYQTEVYRMAIFIRQCDVMWNSVISSVRNKNGKFEYNTYCDKNSKKYESCVSDNQAYAKTNLTFAKIKENVKEKTFIIPYNKINDISSRSYYTEESNTNPTTIEIGINVKDRPISKLPNEIVWGNIVSYKNALTTLNNYAKEHKIRCQPRDSCGNDTCEKGLFDTMIILRRLSGKEISYFKIEEIIDISDEKNRMAIFIRKCNVRWNQIIQSVINQSGIDEVPIDESAKKAYAEKNLTLTKIKENIGKKTFIISPNDPKFTYMLMLSNYTNPSNKNPVDIQIGRYAQIKRKNILPPYLTDVKSYVNTLNLINDISKGDQCVATDLCGTTDTCEKRLFDTVIILRSISDNDDNKMKIETIVNIP